MTNDETAKVKLQPWIEPAIESLDVDETNGLPNTGTDGGTYANCTRS